MNTNMNYIKKNYGDIIGSFNGVQAYSNTDDFNNNNYTDNKIIDIPNYYNNVYTGLKWQCVEYVRRYLIIKHNITFTNIDSAFQIPDAKFMTLHGEIIIPKKNNNLLVGSIIIFPKDYEVDSPDGHVGIISSVLQSGINIVEQNYNDNIFPRFISYNDLKNFRIINL
jgi:glutathionylspermidine amidase/synthetase